MDDRMERRAAASGIPFEQAPGYEIVPPLACERRLHARAHDHWASLLRGRACPAIADLDHRDLADFAATSVLVELAREDRPPIVHFLGRGLAAEAAVAAERPDMAEVPRGSVLGQLMRRLPAVRDHGRPVGLEADHPGSAGAATLYRGILLPFADERGAIAYVYGVISWRRLAGAEVGADIVAAVGSALACMPAAPALPAWEGHSSEAAATTVPPLSLERRLAAARTWAALAAADRPRRPARLHAALSAAHELLIAAECDGAGADRLAKAEAMAAIDTPGSAVRLVFGAAAPRADRSRFAAVLAHARRLGIGAGLLGRTLDRYRGGVVAFALAEHQARRLARGGVPVQPAPPPSMRLAPIDAASFGLLGHHAGEGETRTLAGPALRRIVAG